MRKINVLIAGIGGASLGTEILKCLGQSDRYRIFGCDISEMAYGLYEDGFEKAFKIDRNNYVADILALCRKQDIDIIIPGGEEPTSLLSRQKSLLAGDNILLAVNDPEVVALCSDKAACFKRLQDIGVAIPLSSDAENFEKTFPKEMRCVVKPSTGSGGSSFVFLARDRDEAAIYVEYLLRNKQTPIVQEYVSHDAGEFTVGTLRIGDKTGSIALKRLFNSKLSVLQKGEAGLISTGYSQGLIEDFPEIRATCEKIAVALGSTGPLNVQGRVKNGEFVPFEINPRFSASSYLRAMAGFNEIDLYLRHMMGENVELPQAIKYGYYLRSLTEQYVPQEALAQW